MSGRIGNSAQSDILKLIFQNTAWANVGNTAGLQPSSAAGSFYVALHTADPGAGGTQATSEAAYTGYARVAVARSSGGWTLTGSSPTTSENTAAVTFPACTGGSETETWFSIGTQVSGATEYIYAGPLGVNTTIAAGSSGNALPQATINVASTTGFLAAGTFTVTTDTGSQTVTYTGTSGGNQFTGCTGGGGHLYTGSPVFQADTLAVSNGITPAFAINALTATLD